jgi:UTP--glucose-1-phosphate uridylyltransferase
MSVTKAVIPAAGLGTRFLPATKAVPKEMLPLVDRPMLHYVVEEAVKSGIDHIIIVTSRDKHSIEDYFDTSSELKRILERKGDYKSLEELNAIESMADITYIRQKDQLGLGHAVLSTMKVVGQEPFCVLLPDDIIQSPKPVLREMIKVYERYDASVVAVETVPNHDVNNYGIILPLEMEERVYLVQDLVEKPSPEQAPSNMAIVGRYILDPEIFLALSNTAPGISNEIQLTDGMATLMKNAPIYAYSFDGTRYDVGNPEGMLKASLEIALARPDMGSAISAYIKDLARRIK